LKTRHYDQNEACITIPKIHVIVVGRITMIRTCLRLYGCRLKVNLGIETFIYLYHYWDQKQ